MDGLFEQITNDYMLQLLNWAYRKVGEREQAEDLTQEILLQIFSAIKKSDCAIREPEHFVWKIAHYTWCNYLRKNRRMKMCVSIEDLQIEDGQDLAAQYAEEEEQRELMSRMRSRILRLDRLHRDIMISFYLEGLSVRTIASRNRMTESAVKWHLFNTRKKLKKEIVMIEQKDYVYRPGRLHIALQGEVPGNMASADIGKINDSLAKQNICLACYHKPRTEEELTEMLGIPRAYIESDLNWLVEKEFVIQSGRAYATAFIIEDTAMEQERYAIYLKHRRTLSETIVSELEAAEGTIRTIGFYGSDRDFDQLLWLLIYHCCRFLKRPVPMPEEPVRMDGGRYFPLGYDYTEQEDVPIAVDTRGWAYNGSMCSDHFHWFGLYNFGISEIEEMMDACTQEGKQLHELLCELIGAGFRIADYDEQKRFTLAKLVQKGYVTIEGKYALPNFCIFTAEQYNQLKKKIFLPVAEKLDEEMVRLAADMEVYCKDKLPAHLTNCRQLFMARTFSDLAYLTTFFAFEDGKLYRPTDKRDGEFLTLAYVGGMYHEE